MSDRRDGRWQRLNEAMFRGALRAQHPLLYRRFGRTLDLTIEQRPPDAVEQRKIMPLSRRAERVVIAPFVVCLVAGVAAAGVLGVEGRPALAIGAVAAALALAYMLLAFTLAIALAVTHRRRRG